MLRANMILLVLMGGGVALWSSRPSAECRDARARNLPNATAICGQTSAWGGHSSGGYWGGRTWSSGGWSSGVRSASAAASSGIASVARGGFGGAFHGFGGS
jgi:hypothetical protein